MNWSNQQQIGDAGLKIVQFFKMYGNYSRVYNDCIAAIEVAEAKSKLYKELQAELVKDPLVKTLPFTGYLIQVFFFDYFLFYYSHVRGLFVICDIFLLQLL